jgi:NAD(P)-dependent dehydrogenase (short-subunit alcohol dehydrogenase family)
MSELEQWFAGKVTVVTGGGDGIGREISILMAKRGAKVVVTDVNYAKAKETAEIINGRGLTAISMGVDVTKEEQIKTMIQQTVAQFGRLDVAFNNAGISPKGDDVFDDKVSRLCFDVNVFGLMSCMREEIAEMLKVGGGSIVNTASLGAFIGSRATFLHSYVASKHAVAGVTKTAALQYARQDIRVNALCPGVVRTAMLEGIMSKSEEVAASIRNHTPMGRIGEPKEIAEAAVWMASDKCKYMTGHCLIADGGSYAE